MVGTMITNNAVGHSPETHARATAAKIVIDPWPQDDPTGKKRRAASILREQAAAMLVWYHSKISLDNPFWGNNVMPALADFIALTKGTILESHYAQALVQDLIRFELAHEFGSQYQFLCANKP